MFRDPRNSFQGLKNYKTIFWSLRFHGRLFFKVLYVDVQRIWQPEDTQIRSVAGGCELSTKSHFKVWGGRVASASMTALTCFGVCLWNSGCAGQCTGFPGYPGMPRASLMEYLHSVLTARARFMSTRFARCALGSVCDDHAWICVVHPWL